MACPSYLPGWVGICSLMIEKSKSIMLRKVLRYDCKVHQHCPRQRTKLHFFGFELSFTHFTQPISHFTLRNLIEIKAVSWSRPLVRTFCGTYITCIYNIKNLYMHIMIWGRDWKILGRIPIFFAWGWRLPWLRCVGYWGLGLLFGVWAKDLGTKRNWGSGVWLSKIPAHFLKSWWSLYFVFGGDLFVSIFPLGATLQA